MKTSLAVSLAGLAYCALCAAAPQDPVQILATAPLRFEPGLEANRFVARGIRSQFSFEGGQAQIQSDDKDFSFSFAGANRQVRLEGMSQLRSTTALILGNNPAKWRRAVPNYARLQAHELYRGIDVVYYGNAGELEYDLLVKPGADPRQIRLAIHGAKPHLDREGNLVAGFVLKRPVAYQISSGRKTAVASRFRRNADGSYGFALGSYDRAHELVIDPVLTLAQFMGGSSLDTAYAIGHDAHGFYYVAGITYSSDFPTAGAAAGQNPPGNADLFIAKIDPRLDPSSQMIYAAFIGGSANDYFGGMTVDAQGDVFLTGTTLSGDFPTAQAAQSSLNGASDAFAMMLDVFETPIYSTYLGGSGSEAGNGITLDSKGRMWITGGTQSDDFPVVVGFQAGRTGSQDVFVAGIDPTQSGSSSLIYSTYMGGSWWDVGRGIAAASDGTLWVAGATYSYDFPMAGNSYQPNYQSGGDAFIAHIDPNAGGSAPAYSSFLGGNDLEEARSVVLDSKGRVVVSGYTLSTNFPVTSDAMQAQYGGNTDVFVTILDPVNATTRSGQLAYSTYFGGTNADVAFDLKIDSSGNLYLAGFTTSSGLPSSANALQAAYDQTMDAFALKFNPSTPGSAAISYFSYLGSDGFQVAYGIDFDANNNLYLAGVTSGPIFDALGGPGKGTNPGDPDAFVIGFPTR